MDDELRRKREATVREHMESENRHDFDTTIGTFSHPRYEICATGDVYDGEEEVRAYSAEPRRAFPDQRNEVIELHHADDAVVATRSRCADGPARCSATRSRSAAPWPGSSAAAEARPTA